MVFGMPGGATGPIFEALSDSFVGTSHVGAGFKHDYQTSVTRRGVAASNRRFVLSAVMGLQVCKFLNSSMSALGVQSSSATIKRRPTS